MGYNNPQVADQDEGWREQEQGQKQDKKVSCRQKETSFLLRDKDQMKGK